MSEAALADAATMFSFSTILFVLLGTVRGVTFGAYDAGMFVFFTRPISLLFFLALVATLLYPAISRRLGDGA
jgi:hypothetical protein